MSRPRITKELAGRALAEMLGAMAGQSGSADARSLIGAPSAPPPGSALAELARLKAEAAAAPPTSSAPPASKLTPTAELRQVIREELTRLLATTNEKPSGEKP